MIELTLPGTLLTARRHCSEQCFPYHATWRLFRRAGLKGHPGWHTGFYRTALASWPRPTDRPTRVLVCGASDEAMPRVLVHLLGTDRLHVDLVDACPTPLHLAQHYARRAGLHLTCRTDRAPQLTTCHDPYDLIITDGLLSLLPTPGAREELIARFAELVHPDGLVLYTTRIAGASGVLEYDRLGRLVQSATASTTWRAPAAERRRLAHAVRTRPSRPAPFASEQQLRTVFDAYFAATRSYQRTKPASLVLACAPTVRSGRGSTSIGIAAGTPRSQQ